MTTYRICLHCDRPMRTQHQPIIASHPVTVRGATKTMCCGCDQRIRKAAVAARTATALAAAPERLAKIAAVTATNWPEHAACRALDLSVFFPPPRSDGQRSKYAPAKKVCGACPASAFCIDAIMEIERGAEALLRHGMYGGLTPGQRSRLDPTARQRYELTQQAS